MDYSSLLNKAQLEAVTTCSQYVRIVAGAGSGKTRVLTYRISYLISELDVDPRRILAIAFTNKVANEMRTRVCKTLNTDGSFVRIMTFHSFCAYFLRQEARYIGYPLNYTIFDEEDQASLVKEIGVSFGLKKGDKLIKEALEYIRHCKARGKYPEDINNFFRNPLEKEYLRYYKEYEKRKISMFAFDFDDLLLKTIFILKTYMEVRERWANRYDHILVDEFQDVNDVQDELMQYLTRPDTCLYVVGDPDQTIYSWRGANQDIIMKFDFKHPGTETVVLDKNYRSTKTILNAANKLIAKNKYRVPKDLYTDGEEGEPIVTRKFYSDNAEAEFIAREVNKIAKSSSGSPNYKNIAVLYRSAYLTRALEREFAGRGIPYKLFGGLRFYQRKEVKDVLAYMRLISNPLDDVSFERIVNVPRRGIGESNLEVLKAEAQEKKVSLFNAIDLIDPETSNLSSRAVANLRLFSDLIKDIQKKLNDNYETYSSSLKEFVTNIGYYDYLIEEQDPDEDRVANVRALFDDMDSFISRHEGSTYEEFLQNVSLLTSQDDIKDGNFVTFMTVHIAKGLEFDNVFVIGLSSGAFPNPRSLLESPEKGIEEERRLAYVAFTRAKQRLYLTCNTGFSYVANSNSVPSQFFNEAGLPFPAEEERRGFSSNGWKDVGFYSQPTKKSFFDDGDHIEQFEEEPEEEEVQTNGISDWEIGDYLQHEKFGVGVVTATLGNNLIVVKFETSGVKTLVGNHPMISKIDSKGGKA